MFKLIVVAIGLLAGLGHTTADDGALFMSQNISTVEGDVYAVTMETEKSDGKDIVHSTMNGNGSQTVITDHVLNIRIVIPDSKSEDCYFLELEKEEQTEPSLDEDMEGVATTMEKVVTEKVNATDERTCLYDDDEPDMTKELRTTLASLCGPRKIRHLTRQAECQDIPQDESQQAKDSEETESGMLARRKRWSSRICPYKCYTISRRVRRCRSKRKCFLFFCRTSRGCVSLTHYYRKCGHVC